MQRKRPWWPRVLFACLVLADWPHGPPCIPAGTVRFWEFGPRGDRRQGEPTVFPPRDSQAQEKGFAFVTALGGNFPLWYFSLPTRQAPRLWGPRPSAVPLFRLGG